MSEQDYPTDEDLQRIREWPSTDLDGLMAFVRACWKYADWGWSQEGPALFDFDGRLVRERGADRGDAGELRLLGLVLAIESQGRPFRV